MSTATRTLTLLVLLVSCAVLAAAQAARTPAVLFTGGYGGHCNYQVANKLVAAGFALNATPWPGLNDTPLTLAAAKPYNVIVLQGFDTSNADMTLSARNTQTQEALHAYLSAGGGVLVLPMYGQVETGRPAQETFLKALGLTPLVYEMPFDTDSRVTATSWELDFALTRNIAESPITAGIKTLWYPTLKIRAGAQAHVIPFRADNSWTVLVKGEKTSFTKNVPPTEFDATKGTAGAYQQEVPLVACKQVGKGRIVYLGITPEYLLGAHAHSTLEGIVLERGLRQIPSGGYQLVENALKWLAEPSLQEAELGGAPMNAELLKNPQKSVFGQPFTWQADDQIVFPHEASTYPGVIGARTKYSTGTATADEWVAKAKAKGLAYIVFLEEFAQLTADEFSKLKADCARLTTPEFTALPGFTIDDEIGNHYFYFGSAFSYPDKMYLSKDGTVFVSHYPGIGQDPYLKGQLAMTVLEYAYGINSFKLTAGNYLFSQDAAPFSDWFSDYDAVGVVTVKNGKVLEDATRDYLQIASSGNGPTPMVINLMDSPGYLDNNTWHTVLRLPAQGGQLVDGKITAATKITDYFNLWHFYPDNPSRIYVTSGPEIATWSYVGARDYGGDNNGDFTWQNLRWQLRGVVKSVVGLKEVAVYDGTQLFRRFDPQGRKDFQFTLDLTHDRQHNLVMVATDLQGGKAVSGEQWDRHHRCEETMCGDRNNQLSYGYLTNKDGIGMVIGGNQTLATPNKRVTPGIAPAGTFRNDALLGAPAFDGGAGGDPNFYEVTRILPETGAFPMPAVTEARRLLHNGDVNVGEGQRELDFTDNIGVYSVWATLWRTQPNPNVTINKRNFFFNVNPDSPLAVFLWQIDITLKRDIPNKGIGIGILSGSKETLWAVRDSEGMVSVGNWEDTALSEARYYNRPFGKGAYVALLNSPLGGSAAISLTDGLNMSVGLPARTRFMIDLSEAASPKKAGETKRVNLLLLGIPRVTNSTRRISTASTETVERFYRDFGMDGGKTGYSLTADTGKVTGQRYILDIDGKQAQAFSGKLKGNLISSLPIAVTGLNDQWTAYLFDRGRNAARPIGMLDGKAWATVCLNGDLDLFVGHPIIADNLNLVIQLTQAGANDWRLEVHNPTTAPITATVKKNPFFDPLKAKPFTEERMTIPAGSSVTKAL